MSNIYIMDIIEFLQIDEILINIILQVDDVDILRNLYQTSKIFTNHFENTFILNKLSIKYDLQKYTINNFLDLVICYQFKVDAPQQFNIPFHFRSLSQEFIWKKRDVWINRLHKVKSKLIDNTTNARTSNQFTLLAGILVEMRIQQLINFCSMTPSEDLYDSVNNLYLQSKNKSYFENIYNYVNNYVNDYLNNSNLRLEYK